MAEKGKAVKVYKLTPFGQEMAALVKKFEWHVRIDVLEELRAAVTSEIKSEDEAGTFGRDARIAAYNRVLVLIVAASAQPSKAFATPELIE